MCAVSRRNHDHCRADAAAMSTVAGGGAYEATYTKLCACLIGILPDNPNVSEHTNGSKMKLLLFSDLHANYNAAQILCERARHVDIVIGAGDFANAGRGLTSCIALLSTMERPTILVAGNNETTDDLCAACANWSDAHVLHGTSLTIAGVTFFGIGGGIPVTPFGSWSYDFTEEQASILLTPCPAGCVLISHSPPYEAVDVSSRGTHLGSRAVRAAVEHCTPQLVVCGHIHASAGHRTLIGTTPIINVGPKGVEWELPGVSSGIDY